MSATGCLSLTVSAASMLKENPQKRPNIFEVVQEMCKMQGKEVPIRDVRFTLLLMPCVKLLTLN